MLNFPPQELLFSTKDAMKDELYDKNLLQFPPPSGRAGLNRNSYNLYIIYSNFFLQKIY